MAAAGGAGSGAAAATAPEDRYGDVWTEFRFGIEIFNDALRDEKPSGMDHPRVPFQNFGGSIPARVRIMLDPAFTGKWDRYFIYKDLNIINRYQLSESGFPKEGTSVHGMGILIDNYGQSYKFALGYRSYSKTYDYMRLSAITVHDPEIKIIPDYDNYQKLTNGQIDYIKENVNLFQPYGADPFTKKTLGKLCGDESKKDTEIAELQTQLHQRDEEIARLRELLRESTRREIAAHNERNVHAAAAAAPAPAPAPANRRNAANNDPRAPNARRRRNTRRSRK